MFRSKEREYYNQMMLTLRDVSHAAGSQEV